MRTFPQFSYHFCPFYNASVLTERLRFAILKIVQMSGDHRHQRPLTSLEKQDSWLSGLLYHVIFFSDLYIKRSGNGVTVVVDARTEAAKRIEHRMSGYETKKKQKSILPSLYNKLKLAAEIVATSDSGLRDSWTTLRYRDKNKYPFSIFSWKAQTSDALRMYVSHIAMDKVDDESVRKILEENGVTHLLMLLGACDKNNQEELLPVFTGRTRRIEAADGAGV